jgi:hypothetical protein
MRTLASLAAAAAIAVGLAAGAGPAFADDEDDDDDRSTVTIERPTNTRFDLGIDVSPIPATLGAVRAYLGSLAPVTRDVILSTCEHYMETPQSVRSRATLNFCSIAVGG